MNDQISTDTAPSRPAVPPVARRSRAKPRAFLFLIALLAAAAATGYWYLNRDLITTDDAYTDGDAVTVAPRVAGIVSALLVTDNQAVKAGDTLVRIDPSPFQAVRDQAAANLMAAEAEAANARVALDMARVTAPARLAVAHAQLLNAQAARFKADADAARQRALPRGATMQQDLDTAEAAARSAAAQVAQAEAAIREADQVAQTVAQAEARVRELDAQVALAKARLDQAALDLSWTNVVAPQDGWITRRNVEQGNYVAAGQAIMALVTNQLWVTANFKEDQLNRMRPGQPVDITVDAYSDLRLKGHVDSIQLGSGQRFSAFPAENATGNFVKIVQRVPVKILIDSGLDPDRPLPLGLSVNPVVRVK